MTEQIAVIGIYAGLCVSELDAARQWYTHLFGRGPDDLPLPNMVQWRNLGPGAVQLWQEPDKAGQSITTIVVPDLAAERARLAPLGLVPNPDVRGDFGAIAQLYDPDGNRIVLAEPPRTAG